MSRRKPATDPNSSIPLEHTEPIRIGKDEMNLVEYPFATLRHEVSPGTIIERHWEAEHPVTGRALKASWRVEGSPQLGLPTASDERVFLVLMELTREIGFSQEIYFTRYDLLQRLQWPHNAKSYARLTDAFRRLTAVTITSENAFWNPAAKVFHNRGFHILESYDIVAEKAGRKKAGAELPLSHFRWSREMTDSFANGYIRSIDLGIALTLDLPLSVRLYRYLDKKKHDGKPFFEIELRRLCEIHLGMTFSKHASTMKVRLQPAHEELVQRDIVQGVEYLPMKTKKAQKVRYLFLPPSGEPVADDDELDFEAEGREFTAAMQEPPQLELDLEAEEPVLTDEQKRDRAMQRMVRLGVSAPIATQLIQEAGTDALTLQLDCLAERKPKDAAATFVAAVKGAWAPPTSYTARIEVQEQRAQNETVRRRKVAKQREQAQLQEQNDAEERVQNEALEALFVTLPDWQKELIEAEVAQRMQFVTQHVGEAAAQAGWAATRRQVLREREQILAEGDTAPTPEQAQQIALQNILTKDSLADEFFTSLPNEMQNEIDVEVKARLAQTGLSRLNNEHPAWIGVRRTLLREKLKSGQISGA